MSVYIAAYSTANSEDVSRLQSRPEFRKCTRNMLLCLSALEQVIRSKPELSLALKNSSAFVLGSGHGEISPTLDFLKNLGSGEGARPFYFQNSLYSSTLGFLSLYFGCQGPTYSVTDGDFSGEVALELGMDLLESYSYLDYVFVCGVDICPKQVEESYQSLFSSSEGGAVIVLSKKHESSLSLESIQRESQGEFELSVEQKYQSGALESLCGFLDLNKNFRLQNIKISKRSDRCSLITLKKNN